MTEYNVLLAYLTPREQIKFLDEHLAEARARNVRLEQVLLEIRELLREGDAALFREVDELIRASYVLNEDVRPEKINITTGEKS